jgi:AcrR family transcriptional regulator
MGRAAERTGAVATVRGPALATSSTTVPQAWHSPQRPAHLAAVHPHSVQVQPGRPWRVRAREAVVVTVGKVEPTADTAPDGTRRLHRPERVFSLLNVRSVPDDLTARARIRDAAIRRFGTEGLEVGLRAIAADAGVSPALVLHHFGSKDGLRDACDEHALDAVRAAKSVTLGPSGPDQLLMQLASVAEYAPVVAYLMRAMAAGGPRGRQLLEHFTANAEEYVAEGVAAGTLRPSRDEKARVRWMTLTGMGAMLLAFALEDEPPSDVAAWLQRYVASISLPAFEAFTEGILADRRMLDTYLAYVASPAAEVGHERTDLPPPGPDAAPDAALDAAPDGTRPEARVDA